MSKTKGNPQTVAFLEKAALQLEIKSLIKRNGHLFDTNLTLIEGTELLINIVSKAVDAFRPFVHLLPDASATPEQKKAKKVYQEMEKLFELAK